MGEIIRKLGNILINKTIFEVELNKPVKNKEKKEIHIQNEKLRYEFSENEFLRYALLTILAQKKLKKIKNIK